MARLIVNKGMNKTCEGREARVDEEREVVLHVRNRMSFVTVDVEPIGLVLLSVYANESRTMTALPFALLRDLSRRSKCN